MVGLSKVALGTTNINVWRLLGDTEPIF